MTVAFAGIAAILANATRNQRVPTFLLAIIVLLPPPLLVPARVPENTPKTGRRREKHPRVAIVSTGDYTELVPLLVMADYSAQNWSDPCNGTLLRSIRLSLLSAIIVNKLKKNES